MPRVEISLYGRAYPVACETGQESRLEALAGYVDGKLRQIAQSTGYTNETRLLMLTSLLLADELFDAKGSVNDHLRQQRKTLGVDEDLLVAAVDNLSDRLAHIVNRVKRA